LKILTPLISDQLILCLFEAFQFYVRTQHPLKKVRLEKSLYLGQYDQGKASRYFAQPPLSPLAKKTPIEKGRKCAKRTLNMHPILILIESQDKMHTST